MSTHVVGVILIFTGVMGGCLWWFLRNDDKRITRTMDEVIRGGRFTGKSEQDRPRMIRGARLVYTLLAGMCVLIALLGIAILVKTSAG
jgi:hypothetical protein